MRRLVRTIRLVSFSVVVLLVALGLFGCDRANDLLDNEEASQSRFARRYMPFDPEWIAEPLIPMGGHLSPRKW